MLSSWGPGGSSGRKRVQGRPSVLRTSWFFLENVIRRTHQLSTHRVFFCRCGRESMQWTVRRVCPVPAPERRCWCGPLMGPGGVWSDPWTQPLPRGANTYNVPNFSHQCPGQRVPHFFLNLCVPRISKTMFLGLFVKKWE